MRTIESAPSPDMKRILASHISTGVSCDWTLHCLRLSNHAARMCDRTIMKSLVLAVVMACAVARPEPPSSYGPPSTSYGVPAPQYGPPQRPIVHKHVYVHVPPPDNELPPPRKPIHVPPPQKHYKIVFIKAPTPPTPTAPVIPLQPQNEEKTLVYVLVKKPEEQPDIIIPTPAPTQPSKPEVYFIRYKTQKQEGYPAAVPPAPQYGPPASAPSSEYGAP